MALNNKNGTVKLINGVGIFRYPIKTPKPDKLVDVICKVNDPVLLNNLYQVQIYIPPKPAEVITIRHGQRGNEDVNNGRTFSYYYVTSNDKTSTAKVAITIQEYDGSRVISTTKDNLTLVAGKASNYIWHSLKYRTRPGKIVVTLTSPQKSTDTYEMGIRYDTTNWRVDVYQAPTSRTGRAKLFCPGLPNGTRIGSHARAWTTSLNTDGDPNSGYASRNFGLHIGTTPSKTMVVKNGTCEATFDISPEDFLAKINKGLPKIRYNRVNEWSYYMFPIDAYPGWTAFYSGSYPSTVTIPIK